MSFSHASTRTAIRTHGLATSSPDVLAVVSRLALVDDNNMLDDEPLQRAAAALALAVGDSELLRRVVGLSSIRRPAVSAPVTAVAATVAAAAYIAPRRAVEDATSSEAASPVTIEELFDTLRRIVAATTANTVVDSTAWTHLPAGVPCMVAGKQLRHVQRPPPHPQPLACVVLADPTTAVLLGELRDRVQGIDAVAIDALFAGAVPAALVGGMPGAHDATSATLRVATVLAGLPDVRALVPVIYAVKDRLARLIRAAVSGDRAMDNVGTGTASPGNAFAAPYRAEIRGSYCILSAILHAAAACGEFAVAAAAWESVFASFRLSTSGDGVAVAGVRRLAMPASLTAAMNAWLGGLVVAGKHSEALALLSRAFLVPEHTARHTAPSSLLPRGAVGAASLASRKPVTAQRMLVPDSQTLAVAILAAGAVGDPDRADSLWAELAPVVEQSAVGIKADARNAYLLTMARAGRRARTFHAFEQWQQLTKEMASTSGANSTDSRAPVSRVADDTSGKFSTAAPNSGSYTALILATGYSGVPRLALSIWDDFVAVGGAQWENAAQTGVAFLNVAAGAGGTLGLELAVEAAEAVEAAGLFCGCHLTSPTGVDIAEQSANAAIASVDDSDLPSSAKRTTHCSREGVDSATVTAAFAAMSHAARGAGDVSAALALLRRWRTVVGGRAALSAPTTSTTALRIYGDVISAAASCVARESATSTADVCTDAAETAWELLLADASLEGPDASAAAEHTSAFLLPVQQQHMRLFQQGTLPPPPLLALLVDLVTVNALGGRIHRSVALLNTNTAHLQLLDPYANARSSNSTASLLVAAYVAVLRCGGFAFAKADRTTEISTALLDELRESIASSPPGSVTHTTAGLPRGRIPIPRAAYTAAMAAAADAADAAGALSLLIDMYERDGIGADGETCASMLVAVATGGNATDARDALAALREIGLRDAGGVLSPALFGSQEDTGIGPTVPVWVAAPSASEKSRRHLDSAQSARLVAGRHDLPALLRAVEVLAASNGCHTHDLDESAARSPEVAAQRWQTAPESPLLDVDRDDFSSSWIAAPGDELPRLARRRLRRLVDGTSLSRRGAEAGVSPSSSSEPSQTVHFGRALQGGGSASESGLSPAYAENVRARRRASRPFRERHVGTASAPSFLPGVVPDAASPPPLRVAVSSQRIANAQSSGGSSAARGPMGARETVPIPRGMRARYEAVARASRRALGGVRWDPEDELRAALVDAGHGGYGAAASVAWDRDESGDAENADGNPLHDPIVTVQRDIRAAAARAHNGTGRPNAAAVIARRPGMPPLFARSEGDARRKLRLGAAVPASRGDELQLKGSDDGNDHGDSIVPFLLSRSRADRIADAADDIAFALTGLRPSVIAIAADAAQVPRPRTFSNGADDGDAGRAALGDGWVAEGDGAFSFEFGGDDDGEAKEDEPDDLLPGDAAGSPAARRKAVATTQRARSAKAYARGANSRSAVAQVAAAALEHDATVQ